MWKEHKSKFSVGRLYYSHPSSGERYYLRMLLDTVKGCTSFEDIRTINGIVYPTFKEACRVLGFLDDDKEWIDFINEAAIWASGTQLRMLFTTIICNCEVTDPKKLWESKWQVLSEDMQYRRRIVLNFPTLQLSDSQMKVYALVEIEKLMWQVSKSMKDYLQIETPSLDQLGEIGNRLMNEEMSYDMDIQREEHQRIYNNLNVDEKTAFNAIMESVDSRQGKPIYGKQ
jgi:hypothetical protein